MWTLPAGGGTAAAEGASAEGASAEAASATSTEAASEATAASAKADVLHHAERIDDEGYSTQQSQPLVLSVQAEIEDAPAREEKEGQSDGSSSLVVEFVVILT